TTALPTLLVDALPPISTVRTPDSITLRTAVSIAFASTGRLREYCSIIAMDSMAATGFTMPLPAISGADPTIKSELRKRTCMIGLKHTVNRLIDTIDAALAVRNPAQTSTGKQSKRTGDNASLVADDIAKEVARDDNPVQLPRIFNHQHGCAVDE